MIPDTPPPTSHGWKGVPAWYGRGLAKAAYLLACIGPLSLTVMAWNYSPFDPKEGPPRLVQLLFWALALSSPLSVGMAILAYRKIPEFPKRRSGVPYALAAVVVGIVGTPVVLSGVSLLNEMRWDHYLTYRGNPACASHLRILTQGMVLYTQDYDGFYPPCSSWNEATWAYVKRKDSSATESVFRCPLEVDQKLPSYAMNSHLQGVNANMLEDQESVTLLFESVPGKNRAGAAELLPAPSRHGSDQVLISAVGHVDYVSEDRLKNWDWTAPVKAPPKRDDKPPKHTNHTK